MPHPHTAGLSLPCEHEGCDILVDVTVNADDWLDGTVTVRCPAHRTPTSTP